MSTSNADRVMKTVTRFFEVATEDTDRTCPAQDAARRASADPEFRDALTRVLEADYPRGSFSACAHVGHGDGGADVIALLPDGTECSAGQAYALQAKVRDAAGSDPRTGSCLVLLLMAAIHVDRSSLGTTDAWSLRREPSAGDIAAVRKTLRRLSTADATFPAPPTVGEEAAEGRREQERPDNVSAPDLLRASMPAGLAADLLRASTPADLAAALERFRLWAGEPSFRAMARRAWSAVSPSTLATAVHAERLPTLMAVSAFVTGCGGGSEELAIFAAAWRRIRLSGRTRPGNVTRGRAAR